MGKKSKQRREGDGDSSAADQATEAPEPPREQAVADSAAASKKKSRRLRAGDSDTQATEAPQPREQAAPAADSAPPSRKKSRRLRGGDASEAVPAAVSPAGADSGMGSPEPQGKKHKHKKRKKDKQIQSPSDSDAVAAGKSVDDCTDGEGALGDVGVSMNPTNGEDSGFPEANIGEEGTKERKKFKVKKRKKDKTEQSLAAADGGDGAPGDDEDSMRPRNGEDTDCPVVSIADKEAPEMKVSNSTRRRKNKQERSAAAVADASDVAAGKSGNDCTDGEGATGVTEFRMSHGNGENPDCPEVNITEKGTPERKKTKLKKRKNRQEQSHSTVSDGGAVEADRSGNGCTDGGEASGDAEVNMSTRNEEDPDSPEANITERGTPERKKTKLKKQKTRQEQSHSAVSDGGAVEADRTGNGCTDGDDASGDAEVSMSTRNEEDPDSPEANITERGTPERKKTKLKKQKTRQEQSHSAVSDGGAVEADRTGNGCTDGDDASGDAEVSMSTRNEEDPDCTEVSIAEKGAQEGKKPKSKKRKNDKERSTSVVLDANAVVADESGNGYTISRNREDTDCPEVNIAEKGTADMKKPRVKKRKKNRQEQSPSTTSDVGDVVVDKSEYGSTNVETASRAAEVAITEDLVAVNKDYSQEPKMKKQKKNKQEQSSSAVPDTCAVVADKSGKGCSDGEGAQEDYSQKPKIKKQKKNKQEQSSSAVPDNGVVVADKSGKGCTDGEGAQEDSEDPDHLKVNIGEDSVEENNGNKDNSQKPKQKKRKTKNMNQVDVTEAPSVDVKSEAIASNVSLALVQDVEINAKAKAECVRARSDKSVIISMTSTSRGNHKEKVQDIYSPRGSLVRFQRKKLLILDLNGLLADINQDHYNAHLSHAKVRGKLVFKRPYYDDFLRFCFQNFELGVWSSRMRANVDTVVNILMKDLKRHLLFCWDLSKCTTTGYKTLENKQKPLVLKELKKLWNKEEPDLPWEQGEFSPSNTLLVDDSPYKALRNPPYTAIFPHPYSYRNKKDNSLGPGGDLRVYLENLAAADDVQHYVQEHPFGQPFITESDRHWNFYVKIHEKLEKTIA